MTHEEITQTVLDSHSALIQGEYEEAAALLSKALEGIRKFTGEPTLGDYFYGLQAGALWEFDREGWVRLMERIAAGRGYSLANYGRCLCMDTLNLADIDQRRAKIELGE